MSQSFTLFPWDRPFLEHLQEYMCQECGNDLGRSVLIVPHNRPRRYVTDLLCHNPSFPRPAMLPRMLTIGEMTGLFRAHVAQNGQALGRKAALLDCVHVAYRAVQEVSASQEGEVDFITQQFAQKDLAHFLPWGLRLVALFEEYMNQLLPVRDILYTEGEVSPLASALLSALGRIHKAYVQLLQQEGWTTTALDAYIAAEALQQNMTDLPPLLAPNPQENRHVFVAGFSTITQCEHVMLKALWQKGAHICLHSDPALAQEANKGESVHFSCADHVQWLRQWKAHCSLYMPPSGRSPQVHFMAGYDVHSQLLHMQDILEPVAAQQQDDAQPVKGLSTAVVLSSASLLMPTLHHLPDMPFNVSMGYPLEQSSLFALLESLLRLQEGARGEAEPQEGASSRRYYWRDVLHALRHPFVQMLSISEQSLYSLWGKMEKALRRGNAFVSEQDLLTLLAVQEDVSPEVRAFVQRLLSCLLGNFATVHSTHGLGEAMGHMCHMLLMHGQHIWKSHPLDAESLYRLTQHVIPTLKGARMAHEPLPLSTLFALCRQLIRSERVPFEAAPLQGLQVLGMLETRLLHFEKIVVLDATDDALPGFAAQDPLLPDALRELVGLPALQERERVVAHTLYRLLSSAKEVHFCWQEGMQRSELFDAKKIRSRFVDAYLWKEEQERGYILENGTHPLQVAPCPVTPMAAPHAQDEANAPVGLPSCEALRQKVATLLEEGISPTKLDGYLRCPLRFAWENLYALRPLDEVNEGDDPAAVGDLLHRVLHEAYAPWEGKVLPPEAITFESLQQIFEQLFALDDAVQALPPQSRMLLRLAAPVRFKRFLEAQAEQAAATEIVTLEKKLTAPIQGRFGQVFHVKGVLDRVDRRSLPYAEGGREGLVVLDYKSGHLPSISMKAWADMDLWTAMDVWKPTAQNSQQLLTQVADAFSSVQLPCYIHICQHKYNETPLNAALVDMGNTGQEKYMLSQKLDDESAQDIMEVRVPQLLSFLADHMYAAQNFAPREGMHCGYCSYKALCARYKV